MFITSEGGLTTAGTILFAVMGICALLIGGYIAAKVATKRERKRMSATQLVYCAVALALAFATSYIQLFKLPLGGSVTLFSMLFIVLVGNWYGTATGLMVGFAYGILQFIQEPYFFTVLQVCFDYLFAFAALGLSGVFKNSKNGLLKGYILAVLGRGFFATLAGYFFWYSTSPEGFPQSLAWLYPIVYNFSYLLIEGVMTVIVISIPAVSKALNRIKRAALGER